MNKAAASQFASKTGAFWLRDQKGTRRRGNKNSISYDLEGRRYRAVSDAPAAETQGGQLETSVSLRHLANEKMAVDLHMS